MKATRNRKPVEDRFWEKVKKTDGCWLWTAATRGRPSASYGEFGLWENGKQRLVGAHRFAYELAVGQIPEGMQVNHLCEVKLCVNPSHLEVCTPRRNMLYSTTTLPSKALAKTHCPQGHRYDGDNLYYDGGARKCRECRRARFVIINARRRYRAR